MSVCVWCERVCECVCVCGVCVCFSSCRITLLTSMLLIFQECSRFRSSSAESTALAVINHR